MNYKVYISDNNNFSFRMKLNSPFDLTKLLQEYRIDVTDIIVILMDSENNPLAIKPLTSTNFRWY